MLVGEYVVPIVRVVAKGSDYSVARLHGTAFFVNGEGMFLTAAHVLQDASADAMKNGGEIVLLVRTERLPWLYAGHQIIRWEATPRPIDVAIGTTGEPSRAAFVVAPGAGKPWMWTEVWTEVWTAGFPDSATMTLQGGPEYPPRGYHGYITRGIPEGDWLGPPLPPHSELLELSFPIPAGMSGAPLFVRSAGTDELELLGICRGSLASESYEDHREEVAEDGAVSRVERVRVEYHGLAEDLRPLLKWKPNLLGGQALGAMLQPTSPTGGGAART